MEWAALGSCGRQAESGQLVGRVLENERQAALQLANMWGQNDPVFGPHPAALIVGVVRAATGFHPDYARRAVGKETTTRLRRN